VPIERLGPQGQHLAGDGWCEISVPAVEPSIEAFSQRRIPASFCAVDFGK